VGDLRTSILTATIGIGIAIGSIAVGRLCRGRPNPRFVKAGLWGIVACLIMLSISTPSGQHLLRFGGSIPLLILLGTSAAFFAVPVQVFLQSRPPAGMKGRMIAVMNQANFIAIMLSGVVYKFFDETVVSRGWPRSAVFAMMAVMTLPVAIFYRLESGDGSITPPRRANDDSKDT
jgi:acyl-[acyl-carrier-protein]-phospholipid O-acyltransferase/long-chain-fatty-acid--[acyl-carrier-protein] ligase